MGNREDKQGRTFGDGFAEVGNRGFDAIERMIDRLRPNVLAVAFLVYLLIRDFGDKLIDQLEDATDLPPEVIITILTALISVGIGGLIAAMMRMFESPSVPIETANQIFAQSQEQTRAQMFRDIDEYLARRERSGNGKE